MAEAWSGDGRYFLPARKVEPYRLWFEYLKLALADPDIEVDRKFYADWGEIEGQTFSKWWAGATWRTLFAIDTSVRVLGHNEVLPTDDPSLTVRIPLGRDPKLTLRDIQELLEEHNAGIKFGQIPKGKFSLSDGVEHGFLHSNRLASVRLMRRLYEAWLEHRDAGQRQRVQASAMDVYDWGKAWNDKIRDNRWKRERTYLPFCFDTWVSYLRRDNKIKNAWDGEDPENARRQVQRYISRARKIAQNVGRGDFPGSY